MLKRSLEDSQVVVSKRPKNEDDMSSLVVSKSEQVAGALALHRGSNERRSGLKDVNMLLSGHENAVFSISFDPTGKSIASGSQDSKILLWDVYGDCVNYNVLTGHKNAILEIKWLTQSPHIISASADKTVALWDTNKGQRIRKYLDHTAIVNTCAIARDYPTIFASGSDDCTAVIWDIRNKRSVQSIYHDYQVTSVALSHDGQHVYTGGIDNVIR